MENSRKEKFKIKYLFVVVFLLMLMILVNSISYSEEVISDISENVLRLHVIANSNSSEDQEVKYKVRDKVLEYMTDISENCKSKTEAISILEDNLDNVEDIVIKTLRENNFDYNVKLEIGNFDFPTKVYGDISLPSGYYDALKIIIGEGKGENWWCVMFPPLCFVDVSSGIVPNESKELLEENISNEGYSLISDKSDDIKIKFKIVELIESGKIKFKKN